MGYKLNKNDKKNVEYRNAIYRIADIFIERLATPFHWFRLTYYFSKNGKEHRKLLKILHNFTKNIIKERMKNFKLISGVYNKIIDDDDNDVYTMKKNKRRLAMLDILLQAKEDGEQIDYDGICEEVDTFMFEGHDTTATALAFCLMLIANHPEIQEEIYFEIKNILNDDIKPTYKQLQEMDLLERVIKESLRLYPSVHFISRKVEEDTKLNSGLIVPKNTIINFHIFDIHRNPKIYRNPEKFNPDRFLPENLKNRHPFAYIPFSAGPRNCIGQKFAMLEMKSILTGIILNYKLKAIDTPDTIILEVDMILRSKDGIKVKFNPRKLRNI